MSLCPPSHAHNAVEMRCLAVIASTTNQELRRTAERMLANGGRRSRRPTQPGTTAAPAQPAAKNPAPNPAANTAPNWTCTTCTMLNEEGANVCVACNRRRSSELHAEWVCAACTVRNAGSDSVCTTCEQPRRRGAGKEAATKRPRCEPTTWDGNDDDNDDDFV